MISERITSYPFIVLEGLDGTGKSTVSRLVAEKIGAIHVSTPMEPYASSRPKFREETWNALESFEFYLEAVSDASGKIKELCVVRPVICDRYVASTYAYHTGMGLDPEKAMKMIREADLFQPTIGFQLDGTDAVLSKRLAERGSKPLKPEWIAKIRSAYKVFGYALIDTTSLSKEGVVDETVKTLKNKDIFK